MMKAHISAIVPVLNEEKALPATLMRLREEGFEIIVVDGGSTDGTVKIAKGATGKVLISSPGRGRQMNRGAALATGDILFFIHADSLPPARCGRLIRYTLSRPGVVAGAFRLKLDSTRLMARLITAMGNLRSSAWQLPYGDQGLFLHRSVFEALGGFVEWPLMEDVDMVRRLKKRGRVMMAPGKMITSARRYDNRGMFANWMRNQLRLLRYYNGAPIQRLAGDYGEER